MNAPVLPGRRDEDWRWARLDHARALAGAAPPANDAEPDFAGHALLPGARLAGLSGAAAWGLAGAAAALADAPPHPLADAARAQARHGLALALPDGEVGEPVELVHLGSAGASHGASLARLGPGARQTLMFTLADDEHADHWTNHRLDLELAEGAEAVVLLRLANARGLASVRLFARLAAGARLDARLLADGRGAGRADLEVEIVGQRAEAGVHGLMLGRADAALDARTRIEHRVGHAVSSQIWRLVARERAQVSLAGGVGVARHAQKTLAEQSLRGLVLQRTAAVRLKPQLEILADDVRCAHGCAVGQIDPAQLFYLESRGVPRGQARALLMAAFAGEALAGLPPQLAMPLGQWLEGALA